MSLVAAYDSSEEESEDEAPVPLSGKKGLALPPPKKVIVSEEESEPEPAQKQPKSMFSVLPAPKRDVLAELIEETDEPIPTANNIKQKVKISIPSLSKFANEEDDEPKQKKQRLAPKGSGLLAILPEPVNGITGRASFVPHVLTKKVPPAAPKIVKKPPPKPAVQKPSIVTNYSESDDDSEDEFTPKTSSGSNVDFFSLTNQVQPTPAEINLDELLPQAGPSKPEKLPEITYATVEEVADTSDQSNDATEERELSDEAIRKLCGRRQEDMSNIIDIQGETVYADAKEWMLKNLTEEPEKDFSHRDNTPNPTMRRKHQITYLAFQAKERETELKNQWAANRMSKKQTQAKYGF